MSARGDFLTERSESSLLFLRWNAARFYERESIFVFYETPRDGTRC